LTTGRCPSDIPCDPGQTFARAVKLSNDATGDVTVTQKSRNPFTYTFKEGSF
jgi:hypothetical protein